jgi:hypothetical protein
MGHLILGIFARDHLHYSTLPPHSHSEPRAKSLCPDDVPKAPPDASPDSEGQVLPEQRHVPEPFTIPLQEYRLWHLDDPEVYDKELFNFLKNQGLFKTCPEGERGKARLKVVKSKE